MIKPEPEEFKFIRMKIVCFLVLYSLTFLVIISLILGKNTMWFSIIDETLFKIALGVYFGFTGFSIYKVAPWKALDTTSKLRELGLIPSGRESVLREIHATAEVFTAALFCFEAIIFILYGIIEYLSIIHTSTFFSTTGGEVLLLCCFTVPFAMGSASKTIYEQR